MFLHFDLWDDVVHRRVLLGRRKRSMFKGRGLVGELMGCERRGMLWLKRERVLILKLMGSEGVRVESMEMGLRRGLASMYTGL